MTTPPRIHRYADCDELAVAVATRLIDKVVELQAEIDMVNVCLTGGRVAREIYSQLTASNSLTELDPSRMSVWWSDEHFSPTDDDTRHSQQLLTQLVGSVIVDPQNFHPMPASGGRVDVFDAADSYADVLPENGFHLTLLGIGEDGHVGAIFPGSKALESSAAVVGVSDSPKPPAERISLTLRTFNQSQAVWFVACGTAKAKAIARAVSGDLELPAGRVHGEQETHWFVDLDAASELSFHRCQM